MAASAFYLPFIKNDRLGMQFLPLRVRSQPLRVRSKSLRLRSQPLGCDRSRFDHDPSPFGGSLSGKDRVPSRPFSVDLGRGDALYPIAFVPHRSSSGLLTTPCIAFTT